MEETTVVDENLSGNAAASATNGEENISEIVSSLSEDEHSCQDNTNVPVEQEEGIALDTNNSEVDAEILKIQMENNDDVMQKDEIDSQELDLNDIASETIEVTQPEFIDHVVEETVVEQLSEDNMEQLSEDNMEQPSEDNMEQLSESNVGKPSEDNVEQPNEGDMEQPREGNMKQPNGDNMFVESTSVIVPLGDEENNLGEIIKQDGNSGTNVEVEEQNVVYASEQVTEIIIDNSYSADLNTTESNENILSESTTHPVNYPSVEPVDEVKSIYNILEQEKNNASMTETAVHKGGRIIPASEAVPLMTESILSALSEIHGEKSLNSNNGLLTKTTFLDLLPDAHSKVTNENKKKIIKTVNKRGRPALNDKQLLAILQDGPDSSPSPTSGKDIIIKSIRKRRRVDDNVERQIVLKQIREFPRKRKNKEVIVEDVKIPKAIKKETTPTKKPIAAPLQTSTPARVDIISRIRNDWSDDDAEETVAPSTPAPGKQNETDTSLSLNETTQSNLSNNSNNSTLINVTNGESFVKPKRVSRIIKKKVIYDPDNPETFKFASNIVQAAIASGEAKQIKATTEKQKQTVSTDKVLKNNIDGLQTKPETKVKSASPDAKQNKSLNVSKTPSKLGTKKRLTEVDKLLMDEGAVNMLYQMEQSNSESDVTTTEQIKKKKVISNEKKMKIIKKAVINHSKTADQPTKVFRIRKEKSDPNGSTVESKITSVNAVRACMQSPSLSEMSAASVNESRIIRRHSSSSFSSGCLSPRPLSPSADVTNKSLDTTADSGIHNKIVKRKGARQKKASKTLDKNDNSSVNTINPAPDTACLHMKSFTQLSMDVSENIIHIVVHPTGNNEELYDFQVITELTAAIRLCTSGGNAVLLSSTQESLCSGLDLRGLLHSTVEQQRHHAEQLLDAFRELMVALCECRSPLVCCVGGSCVGAGVSLLTLCDLCLASDRATFCVSPRYRRKLPPEGSSLLTRPYALPPQLARELVLCGRKLTASEALQRGLVSRTLWPEGFINEVRAVASDLAQHPLESFSIMKNVLRRGEVTAVTAALRHEARMLLDYWCSAEGQAAILDTHGYL